MSEVVFTDGIKVGPCYQIAAVADGLLCGRGCEVGGRLEENASVLWAMISTGRASDVAWRDII